MTTTPIALRHRDGNRIELPSLSDTDAALLRPALASGWLPVRSELQPVDVPIGAAEKAVVKAPRDTAAQDAATAKLRVLIEGTDEVRTAKALAMFQGITGPQFSAAKKALVKAGIATDPGKGRIAGKAAVAS